MKIQPGKIYLTRDGQRVLIEAETNYPGTYRMQGVYVDGGHFSDPSTMTILGVTWRSREGHFDGSPSHLDLVSEVA
jgi:hypothetical protein